MPISPKCQCGRRLEAAAKYTYSKGELRFTFHRCECGLEWTESVVDVDPLEPITAEEVIAVHERMSLAEDVSLDELTR